MFKSHDAAVLRAGEILASEKSPVEEWRAYKCIYCGGWHLTSQRQTFSFDRKR